MPRRRGASTTDGGHRDLHPRKSSLSPHHISWKFGNSAENKILPATIPVPWVKSLPACLFERVRPRAWPSKSRDKHTVCPPPACARSDVEEIRDLISSSMKRSHSSYIYGCKEIVSFGGGAPVAEASQFHTRLFICKCTPPNAF
jgi:hypothetical protein